MNKFYIIFHNLLEDTIFFFLFLITKRYVYWSYRLYFDIGYESPIKLNCFVVNEIFLFQWQGKTHRNSRLKACWLIQDYSQRFLCNAVSLFKWYCKWNCLVHVTNDITRPKWCNISSSIFNNISIPYLQEQRDCVEFSRLNFVVSSVFAICLTPWPCGFS